MGKFGKAVLLMVGLVYFGLFLWPNSTGAKDTNMLSIFEPDESAQYSHPIRMLTPGKSQSDSLRKFINYQHYYYGFPFYLSSVVFALLPAKLLVGLGNTPLNMLLLRQMISVLPMILAVLVLVYVQTRFKSFISSLALFIFLLTVPAVFENNTWWHPESLTLLFIALTFFFLDRDDLRFGRNFYFAAVTCGLATATKLLGLFFFLAIPMYILMGILQKRITFWKAVRSAALFVAVMGVTFVLVNPFLFNAGQRQFALKIQTRQAKAMSSGWNVFYSKGPQAWYPMIKEMYGNLVFIVLAFFVIVLNIWKNHRRLLNILILAWAIPFTTYLLLFIVIKPHHFLLPIALPLYSSLATVFQILPMPRLTKWSLETIRIQMPRLLWFVLVTLVLGVQVSQNLARDLVIYRDTLYREKENNEIKFTNELLQDYLSKLPEDLPLKMFRDVRIYIPVKNTWTVFTRSKPATYPIIESQGIDLVLMWNQRALDYTQEGVLENAIDKNEMALASQFYQDIKDGNLKGYEELYRTECCSAFLRTELYRQYFP